MRLFKVAIGISLVFASGFDAAFAQPSSSGTIPPEIATAISDWTTCRGSKAGAMIKLPRSTASIVDEAFAACSGYEQIFNKAWTNRYGPESASQVQEMRTRWRGGLIAQINALRAKAPVNDLSGAWGICVGTHIPKPVPRDVPVAVIADSALAACSAEREKVRADTTQKYGAVTATNHIAQIQAEMRKRINMLVEESRAQHQN